MKNYDLVLRRIINGLLTFLLPLVLVMIIMEKALVVIKKVLAPIKVHFPQIHFLGVGLFAFFCLVLLLLICYFAGLLIERKRITRFVNAIENAICLIIPGYSMLKSRASESFNNEEESNWKAVLVSDGDDWRIGIEIEKQADDFSFVFFPEPPDAKSGEIKLIHQSKIKPAAMTVGYLVGVIRKYGKGIQLKT